MTHLRRAIKRDAKRMMRGFWAPAGAILPVLFFIALLLQCLEMCLMWAAQLGLPKQVVLSNGLEIPGVLVAGMGTALVFCFLSAFVMAPMGTGICNWYYRLSDGKHMRFGDFFSLFAGRIWRSWGVYFHIGLRLTLWSILLYALPVAAVGFSGYYFQAVAQSPGQKTLAAMAFLVGMLLWVVATLAATVVACRYILAPYLVGEMHNHTALQAVRLSARYTKGHRGNIFVFYLSFFPWLLLGCFIIPLFFIIPYMSAAEALYARYLIEKGQALTQTPTPMQEQHTPEKAPHQPAEEEYTREFKPDEI